MTASPTPRARPRHGALVAAALPYRGDLSEDVDAYAYLHTATPAPREGA
ncbi:hypothetical protein [Micromonospora musae]|nr:hypothetical protein [Micromonospora musae]